MLYVFAGFPGKGRGPDQTILNAGGLSYLVNDVEELGIVEVNPRVQYRRGGVFTSNGEYGEWIRPVDYRLSEALLREGITWDWFPQHWAFGAGVTMHKTSANYPTRTVDWKTQKTLSELVDTGRLIDMSKIELLKVHNPTESWAKYERRWLPGTCPQESHLVHLTWITTLDKLPEFAYERLRKIVEDPTAELKDAWRYDAGHFIRSRKWDGRGVLQDGPPSNEIMNTLKV